MHEAQKTDTGIQSIEGLPGIMTNQESCLKICHELDIHKHVEVNGDCFNNAVRHIVRNCNPDEFMGDDVMDKRWTPGKYDGCVLAEILQTIIDTAYPQEISNR